MYVFPRWFYFRSCGLYTLVTGFLWLHNSHLHCVIGGYGHGPRTLCGDQNNRETTAGRTVPSLPCLTWKSCLSLIRNNMLGPNSHENYIRYWERNPKGHSPFFFAGGLAWGAEAATDCYGCLQTQLIQKGQDFPLKHSLLFAKTKWGPWTYQTFLYGWEERGTLNICFKL